MKVAIIGAGITGLYLAKKLSEKNINVTVFEKEKGIPKKACSGLVSERILDFLPEAERLIENKIDFSLIKFPKKTIKVYFSKKFFVIGHFKLNQLLFELVKKKRIKIFFGYDVKPLTILTLKKAFDRIIGCDGSNSKVRKFLKLEEPELYLGIQGFLNEKDYSNFVETWPTPPQNFCGGGFFWKIPRGKNVEYGIIEKPKEARKIFENFLKERDLKLERVNSAIIPHAPTPKFWLWGQGFSIPKNEKITLCGDAAGLTKPWSGGGIVWGLMASDLLLKNFPDFLKYQREMKKFFSLNVLFSKFAKNLVYFLGFKFPFLLPKKFKIDGDFLI